jgi:hypothetical protein
MLLQSNGRILFYGIFQSVNGTTRNALCGLDASGTLDAFNPNANNAVYDMLELPDGKLLAAGRFTVIDGDSQPYLAKLNADGTRDTSFNPVLNAEAYCLAYESDINAILVGGFFDTVNGEARNGFARLDTDGTLY